MWFHVFYVLCAMYFVIIILLVDEHADHGHVVVTSRQ